MHKAARNKVVLSAVIFPDYKTALETKQIKTKISSRTTVYPGLFIGFMEGETEDLLKQINVSRSLKSDGVVLFDWAHLGNKYKEALKFCVFTSTCQ